MDHRQMDAQRKGRRWLKLSERSECCFGGRWNGSQVLLSLLSCVVMHQTEAVTIFISTSLVPFSSQLTFFPPSFFISIFFCALCFPIPFHFSPLFFLTFSPSPHCFSSLSFSAVFLFSPFFPVLFLSSSFSTSILCFSLLFLSFSFPFSHLCFPYYFSPPFPLLSFISLYCFSPPFPFLSLSFSSTLSLFPLSFFSSSNHHCCPFLPSTAQLMGMPVICSSWKGIIVDHLFLCVHQFAYESMYASRSRQHLAASLCMPW